MDEVTLDPDALKAAYKAVVREMQGSQYGRYSRSSLSSATQKHIAEIAVRAYVTDLIRQVDEPCEDCNERD